MNVKRFFAANSRAALAMVRKALGPDAVILANKAVSGGNEILALAGADMDDLVAQESLAFDSAVLPKARPAKALRSQPDEMVEQAPPAVSAPVSPQALAALSSRRERPRPVENPRPAPVAAPVAPVAPRPVASQPIAPQPARPRVATTAGSIAAIAATQTPQELERLMVEMRSMRGVIESQLSELVWENVQRRSPDTALLLRRLLGAGFGAGLARQIAENLPPPPDTGKSHEHVLNWAKSVLEKNIRTMEDESEVLEQGGVFALIGPTGVGKTTTTAKLAARIVMKHGASRLGLITTDAYRIGGHEQLRIYGKILGVMVHAVKDETDLRIALQELRGKHTILIDTVGVNQRDEMVTRQIAMLAGADQHIRRLLCINATSTGETLMDVVQAYRGRGLAGCILTKMDEAATIGSALDVMIREKLRLYYVANGQRVPEDLHVANKKLLLHHAFKLRKSAAGRNFQFRDEELPLLMAHAQPVSKRELSLG